MRAGKRLPRATTLCLYATRNHSGDFAGATHQSGNAMASTAPQLESVTDVVKSPELGAPSRNLAHAIIADHVGHGLVIASDGYYAPLLGGSNQSRKGVLGLGSANAGFHSLVDDD